MPLPLIAIGVAVSGLLGTMWYKDKKQREEGIKYEEGIWNNGRCPKCGKKWYTKHFYAQGGQSVLTVECRKCQKYHKLWYIDPTQG